MCLHRVQAVCIALGLVLAGCFGAVHAVPSSLVFWLGVGGLLHFSTKTISLMVLSHLFAFYHNQSASLLPPFNPPFKSHRQRGSILRHHQPWAFHWVIALGQNRLKLS